MREPRSSRPCRLPSPYPLSWHTVELAHSRCSGNAQLNRVYLGNQVSGGEEAGRMRRAGVGQGEARRGGSRAPSAKRRESGWGRWRSHRKSPGVTEDRRRRAEGRGWWGGRRRGTGGLPSVCPPPLQPEGGTGGTPSHWQPRRGVWRSQPVSAGVQDGVHPKPSGSPTPPFLRSSTSHKV